MSTSTKSKSTPLLILFKINLKPFFVDQMKIYGKLWKQKIHNGRSQFVDLFKRKNQKSIDSLENSSSNRRRSTRQMNRAYSNGLNSQLKEHPDFKKNLKLSKSRVFGRYISAAESMNTGKTVIIAQPFASAVIKCENAAYCLTCHKTDANLIACKKCSMVFFCNSKCRSANMTHKFECGTKFHDILDLDVKCGIQLIFEAMATFHEFQDLYHFVQMAVENRDGVPTASNSRESRLDCILKLQPKEYHNMREKNDARETALEAYNNIVQFPEVRRYFGLDNQQANWFLEHFIAYNISLISENGFRLALTANGNECERILIYGALSFLNHSCSPNLLHFIDRNIMRCVTSHKIHSGDQLFISYQQFDENDSKYERQTMLDHWNFKCRCVRCESPRDINQNELQKAENMNEKELVWELNQIGGWTPQKGAYIQKYSQLLSC